jgi:hypothetical protein
MTDPPSPSSKPSRSPAAIRNGIGQLQRRIVELAAFDPAKMTEPRPAELKALSTAIQISLERAFGRYTADCRRFAEAADLQWAPNVSQVSRGVQPFLSDYIHGVARNRERSLVLLREAVRVLNEDLADRDQEPHAQPATSSAPKPPELFTLKPGMWGMSIDLKEAGRRFLSWLRGLTR